MSASERIALVGLGAIGSEVVRLLTDRLPTARIVAVAVSDATRPRSVPDGSALIDDPAALAAMGATLVVEAAGRASVEPWGMAALQAGADFAVSSTSAFVDDALLARMQGTAQANGAQILVPPGALGGIDALAAAATMGLDHVTHVVTKPAGAWAGTEAETLCDLHGLTEVITFFRGTAREAADRFPKNANVAVISSLAGLGLDRTQLALVADPGATANTHRIEAAGAFGRMTMDIENAPLPGNPKSSAMTALNIVRLIENRVRTLVI
ncbi:aspartate dehydrogenase [Lutimaribacter sp. EGI FJ00015]|uniref:Aspartate dehydrogenase n=1 Tax=Lutimaribacter degradans TaxID=2945989 RepID=A0ACC5ZZ09_9RHOB|nr:aspartate dehydrogenase [Lutimaribacter sp. EGI FJ00013]MCM2563148.1 aspartate dehydrogenase [Lutimaribacter sp. EGI FJ00013]MCO0614327.1 aspartate dehydrogenase [Lutimaribacter sp. EGI FJ00015]MCO0637137.1 aspartate dehydrogenase [Lutimaribacter sp. EGI FJ00014]